MHLQLPSDNSERHHHHHDHHHHGRGRFWRGLCILLLLGLGVFVLARTAFFVDETEYVYVTQFGEPIRLYTDAGLGVKWPYQSLRRFDRRLQMYEPSGREMLTEDKENLNVQWYVCWRIPGRTFVTRQLQASTTSPGSEADESEIRREMEKYVHRFLRSVGTVETAESRLEERIQAAIAAEIGHTQLQQLVSLDTDGLQLDAIATRVSESIRRTAADEFGIEVVDVRLKRFNYPEAVKPAVYAEIRSERERVAVQYRAEGASQKAKIESLANLQRDQLLAQARRDATTIRGEGEAKAIEIFNAAHSKDPQFYELLKTLEAYRTILDDQTTVVLSADSPLLKLLTEGLPELPEGPVKLPSSGDPETGEKRETAQSESEAESRVSRVADDGGE
ncbi:MAG: protease modulator HflC [Planctomycetes bacterium]|nr:protease modulator HflC [Planctomycetota bacterium]MBL7042652.1 protease modulator HflC [Pirellulaceae bacterium]